MNFLDERTARRGFSLVEILVTVGILSLLAGLLVSAIGKFQTITQKTKCAHHLRELTMAGLAYAGEHDGQLIYTDLTASPAARWYELIYPYLSALPLSKGLPEVFRCPAAPNWNPGLQTAGWIHISYCRLNLDALLIGVDPALRGMMRLQRAAPAKTPFLFDSHVTATTGVWSAASFNSYVPQPPPYPKWRHSGGINVSYWDGHVEMMKAPTWEELVPKF